jgi:hypothetical protein
MLPTHEFSHPHRIGVPCVTIRLAFLIDRGLVIEDVGFEPCIHKLIDVVLSEPGFVSGGRDKVEIDVLIGCCGGRSGRDDGGRWHGPVLVVAGLLAAVPVVTSGAEIQ